MSGDVVLSVVILVWWIGAAIVFGVVFWGMLIVCSVHRGEAHGHDPIAHLDFECESEGLAVQAENISRLQTVPDWED